MSNVTRHIIRRFPPVGIEFTDLPGGSILFDELEGDFAENDGAPPHLASVHARRCALDHLVDGEGLGG